MPFEPKFTITAKGATALMRIEGAKEALSHFPITPSACNERRRPVLYSETSDHTWPSPGSPVKVMT
jgi:hypothetical protein